MWIPTDDKLVDALCDALLGVVLSGNLLKNMQKDDGHVLFAAECAIFQQKHDAAKAHFRETMDEYIDNRISDNDSEKARRSDDD